MEKNSNLISEVLRIQELLGTSKKPLILEQKMLLRNLMGDEFEAITKASMKGTSQKTLQSLEKKLAKLRSTTDNLAAAGLEDDILKLVDKDKLAQNILSKSAKFLPNMAKVEKGLVGSIKNGAVKAEDAIARMNKVLDASTAITNEEVRMSMKRYYERTFKKAGSEYEQIAAQKIETQTADLAAGEGRALQTYGEAKAIYDGILKKEKDFIAKNPDAKKALLDAQELIKNLKKSDYEFLNNLSKSQVDQLEQAIIKIKPDAKYYIGKFANAAGGNIKRNWIVWTVGLAVVAPATFWAITDKIFKAGGTVTKQHYEEIKKRLPGDDENKKEDDKQQQPIKRGKFD